jgi:hypothetical protein
MDQERIGRGITERSPSPDSLSPFDDFIEPEGQIEAEVEKLVSAQEKELKHLSSSILLLRRQ